MTELETTDALEEWLVDRPQIIKDVARKYPPWGEYKIKSTGQTATLYSYAENGTVTVVITSPTFENAFGAQRQVFGIDVLDLELLNVTQEEMVAKVGE